MKTEFDRQAFEYSKFRPRYPESLFDFLTAQVTQRDLAFDVGTGNGQCAISLAQRFKKVVASDRSAEQIQHAIKLDNIDYFVSDAHESHLENDTVDLITVATALHWFDLEKFFREANRVLKPNGVLAAWSYAWHQTEDVAVNAIFNQIGKEILAEYWSPQPKLIWNEYRDIKFPFSSINASDFTSESEWDLTEFIGYLSTWSATQKYITTIGQHPAELVRDKLKFAWGDENRKINFKAKLVLKVSRKF